MEEYVRLVEGEPQEQEANEALHAIEEYKRHKWV